MALACEAAASSSSTWRGIMDSCAEICHDFTGLVDCDSLLILHRSKWQCLARTYSTVIASLTKQVEKASSTFNQETLCQKLRVSLHALHDAMQEAERCFKDVICKSSDIAHSWLAEKALKFCMSTDIVDIHLHDFIWAYATVKEQALWLGIHLDGMELPDLEEETSILCKIWAAEDAESDLCTAQDQLLTNFMGKKEEETLRLAKFIVDKLTHTIEDKVDVGAHHVLPDFLWADPTNLKRNPDSCIGKGSYGVVYEATWLRGRFAVKDIFYAGEDALSGREQAIQAKLCHPNVINLVCCTKNPSLERFSLVMELMQQDLRLLMKGRKQDGMDPPFTLLVAIDLMLQVAKGMEYLHSLNIMHRDLKSPNILVSFPPISNQKTPHHIRLKIADFGMAKAKEMSSYFTTRPTGTLAWRAPEVFGDKGSDANSRYHKKADVYSFGLVCYEILTGELPFKETQDLYKRVIGGERPKLPNYCPSALASYIEMCWDGNPNARPSFTCICKMLRHFKACILLGNPPNVVQNRLAHLVSSRACAHITGMGQSQDSLIIALPRPLNILLEMYWCKIILQESNEDSERRRREGISDYTTVPSSSSMEMVAQRMQDAEHYVKQVNEFNPGQSRWSITRLFKFFFRNFKVSMRPTITQGAHFVISKDFMPRLSVREFSYKEIKVATNNFSTQLGMGGFGPVYRGRLPDGDSVAIKLAANSSHQGAKEFLNEVHLLSRVHHKNLVGLLGYCNEKKLVLVYEFMSNGSLFDRLHGAYTKDPPLSWHTRLNILVDAAQGFDYLHYGCVPRIIHRDVKSSNILLNDRLDAKISDFGISRNSFINEIGANTTSLMGTMGYIDPEYVSTMRLTEKVDVYSFGVVLLEVVSGKRAVLSDSDSQQATHIVEWARSSIDRGVIDDIVDASLDRQYDISSVWKVLDIALACVNFSSSQRPTMTAVFLDLKEAQRVELESDRR